MAMPLPIIRQPRQLAFEIDVRLPEIQPLISRHEPQLPELPACAWGPSKTISIFISTRGGEDNIPVLYASIGIIGEVEGVDESWSDELVLYCVSLFLGGGRVGGVRWRNFA